MLYTKEMKSVGCRIPFLPHRRRCQMRMTCQTETSCPLRDIVLPTDLLLGVMSFHQKQFNQFCSVAAASRSPNQHR